MLGAALYFWVTSLSGLKTFNLAPSGYYGLLTAGFRGGHLYAAITPEPALLALKDPYDPVANAPYRVHDMVLWRGHYYLYHGVTPVMVFFWPLAAVTGRYPSEPFAVAVFCSVGLFAAVVLLAAVHRRYFPSAPPWSLALGAACLAFASPCADLACGPQFYEVPIACAVCLEMLMFGAVFLALRAERPSLGWLAAASLAFGLSLGARPDYVFGGLGLALPCVWMARRRGGGRAWLSALVGAFGPAAACGMALLAYNEARFGSPTEFGMHYQLAGAEFVQQRLLGPESFWANLRQYLFQPGIWSRYFPFFSPPGSRAFGIARCLPWCWLGLLALAGASRSKQFGCRIMVGTLAVCAVANL
ncbi:MAG TPA: hypothetical protein VHV47_07665, partial [Opitutaceae bacterium]|nr:hypothetical protein [Opitutaceae bacterium]